jgi:hypothetical protein
MTRCVTPYPSQLATRDITSSHNINSIFAAMIKDLTAPTYTTFLPDHALKAITAMHHHIPAFLLMQL